MCKIKLLMGISVILLAGCRVNQNTPPNISSAKINTETLTMSTIKITRTSTPTFPINTNTLTPTITITQRSSTPTPSPTATLEMSPPKTECLEIMSQFPENTSQTGSILFLSSPLLKMNLETKDQLFIPNEDFDIGTFSPSPDQKRIAFHDYLGHKLMLMDAKGNREEVLEWNEKWWGLVGWLNESQVLIRMENHADGEMIPPLGVVDIYTKEYKEIERDYPRISTYEEFIPWFGWRTITIYNPSLSMVAYPGAKQIGDDIIFTFVLFDLIDDNIAAEVKDYRFRTVSPPQWTQDGEHLLLAKDTFTSEILPRGEFHHEFFLISSDGNIFQLTHLNDFHEYSEIGGYTLSYDGHKVAFWFRDRSINAAENLYVLDLQTLEVVNTCISSEGINGPPGPAPPPIWAPDSEALITWVYKYKVEGDPYEMTDEILFIDIRHNFVVKIAEGKQPFGWLVNSPAE